MRWTVPERPIHESEQTKKEAYVLYPVLFIGGGLMVAGCIYMFNGFVEKLLILACCYFAFWIATTMTGSMRKEYESKAKAWSEYWGDYWEEERQLRLKIHRLPDDSIEKDELQSLLDRMHNHYERYYCN